VTLDHNAWFLARTPSGGSVKATHGSIKVAQYLLVCYVPAHPHEFMDERGPDASKGTKYTTKQEQKKP
jgi:hypothetical protein